MKRHGWGSEEVETFGKILIGVSGLLIVATGEPICVTVGLIMILGVTML